MGFFNVQISVNTQIMTCFFCIGMMRSNDLSSTNEHYFPSLKDKKLHILMHICNAAFTHGHTGQLPGAP